MCRCYTLNHTAKNLNRIKPEPTTDRQQQPYGKHHNLRAICVQLKSANAAVVQVGPVNYAYLKFGPLGAVPPPGLTPLVVVLGYGVTLNGATTQVLRSLARDRTVRAEPCLAALNALCD